MHLQAASRQYLPKNVRDLFTVKQNISLGGGTDQVFMSHWPLAVASVIMVSVVSSQ